MGTPTRSSKLSRDRVYELYFRIYIPLRFHKNLFCNYDNIKSLELSRREIKSLDSKIQSRQ